MTNPPAPASTAAHAPALRILRRLLGGMERPPALRLGNQQEHALEDESGFTLILRDPSVLRRLVLSRDPVLLADAYIRGVIDIEGDLYSALGLKDHLEAVSLSWRDKAALLRDALMLRAPECDGAMAGATIASRISRRFSHRHSRQTDRAAISFHYDVSNAFYGLWLDEQRMYSCGYFETPEDTLDEAQRNKLDHICRKLRLRPGERLLDIGCGWGALTCWAARAYGVHAHGITLSERQLEYAQARICAEGLQDRVTVELRDYRDLPGEAIYDKVSSVGMFEHVGLANLPTYYGIVQRLLRPGGLIPQPRHHARSGRVEKDGGHPVHQPLRLSRWRARLRQQHPARHGARRVRNSRRRRTASALRADAAPLGETTRGAPRGRFAGGR